MWCKYGKVLATGETGQRTYGGSLYFSCQSSVALKFFKIKSWWLRELALESDLHNPFGKVTQLFQAPSLSKGDNNRTYLMSLLN